MKFSTIANLACLLLAVSPTFACPYFRAQEDRRDLQRGDRGGGGRDRGRGGGSGRDGGNGGGGGRNNQQPPQGPAPDGLSITQAVQMARQELGNVANGDRRAQFVRLSFHDCVGGVCDGCIDLSNLDNRGLEDPIDFLEPVVDRWAGYMTKADIYVLAGLAAAEVAQGNNNNAREFPMRQVGRPTCPDPNNLPQRTQGKSHITSSELITFFRENFQFTHAETAAIMGAHTLGNAEEENSGFDGNNGWVPNENALDNQFYRVLLNSNFDLEATNNDGNSGFPTQNFFWRRNQRGNQFMLNVDMALLFNFENMIDSVNGDITCPMGSGDCTNNLDADTNGIPESPLRSHVERFAASNNVWLQEYEAAHLKMIDCPTCDLVALASDTAPLSAVFAGSQQADHSTSLGTVAALAYSALLLLVIF